MNVSFTTELHIRAKYFRKFSLVISAVSAKYLYDFP